jgi:hypothetical protein
MTAVALLGYALALYAVAGVGVGLAFAITGARQVLPQSSFSCGARLMILPGAAALWPYVLLRWLRSIHRP